MKYLMSHWPLNTHVMSQVRPQIWGEKGLFMVCSHKLVFLGSSQVGRGPPWVGLEVVF